MMAYAKPKLFMQVKRKIGQKQREQKQWRKISNEIQLLTRIEEEDFAN